MKNTFILSFLGIFFFIIPALNAESLVKQSKVGLCLDTTQYQIHGISPHQPEQNVIEKFGKPLTKIIIRDFDDGGPHIDTKYIYEGVEIRVGRDTIETIFISNSKYKMPCGIHTGMKKNEVLKILGMNKPNDAFDISLTLCPESWSPIDSLYFLFVENNLLNISFKYAPP